MYMVEKKGKAVSNENLNKASGGVVGDPGFMKKYNVYDNKNGRRVANFWSEENALNYDKAYNRTSGELLNESSPEFARYQSDWIDYRDTQKMRIVRDDK